VDIPERVEQAIEDAVSVHLANRLGDRGLLLGGDDLEVAHAQTAALGSRLLDRLLRQCYPMIGPGLDGHALAFERDDDMARIGAALAFGVVTANVLASGRCDGAPIREGAELLCAAFNLGIGLVDGLCDGDVESGTRLLQHIARGDVDRAAVDNRERGWLRTGLPLSMAADPSVSFTVDVIEVFFECLHDVYPGEVGAQVRRRVADQLALALNAELLSVSGAAAGTSRAALVECSRTTSVLPFEIIETLVTADAERVVPSAATLLGEAMWRIDDLVDLCTDARCGALNGVLLAADRVSERADGGYRLDALQSLLASSYIADAAAEAADKLSAGLGQAKGDTGRNAFLDFIHRYAAMAPHKS
jgi:hypothetical protein